MKVKKFVASNMSEAMKQIRRELGDEAVILNSKVTYTGGWLGLFKKKKLEVIAALDMDSRQNHAILKEKQQKPPIIPVQQRVNIEQNNKNDIHHELTEIKKMVQEMTVNQLLVHLPEPIQVICGKLHEQEINDDIISALSNKLLNRYRNSDNEPTMNQVVEWAKEFFISSMSTFEHGGISPQKKFINLVGPTGVGKTTTLAKIAAGEVLEKRKKIAFITTDTYRIAAIEQLKTYANLLNVPVEVVYKLEDFQKAIIKYAEYDHIFIDTAGRNYREMKYITELENLIDFSQSMETFLTLSTTMKEKDIQMIIKNFESLSINKFIFTKLDETSTYGTIFNLILKNEKGVAYLTNGQDVPDDLEECTRDLLVNHLFEGMKL
ncbi:flagellar biosynthesis protein FlhF [Heyndrickxia vini]|uniref:Flagellar biosynthesis protein FlhF n=1 Tax=Heyndrickxia vini TaxID=1476025 RepID=A0ABX7DZG5_9BACI|nr:flagellar biosynthesis protein FlhF [Heyndrickxia vini]QQZ07932.1 flagellar biosynthesis protein FlhF [Heyndrickxia vini]